MKIAVVFFFAAFVALSSAAPARYVRVGNQIFVVPDQFQSGFSHSFDGFSHSFSGFPHNSGFNTRFQRQPADLNEDEIQFDGPRFQEVSPDEKADVVGVPVNWPPAEPKQTRRPTRRSTPKTTAKPSTSGLKYVRVGDRVYVIREEQQREDEGRFEELVDETNVKSTRQKTTKSTTTTTKPTQSSQSKSTTQKPSFTDKIKKVFSWFSS